MALAPSMLALVPGLALGTFLNNVAAQIPTQRIATRMHATCPRCGFRMSLFESVALLSYLTRRGRCPHCGARRSLRNPLLELTTGALFVGCFAKFGFSGRAFVAAAFCAVLVLLATIDAERRILPNAIVIPAGVVILAADILVEPGRWLEWTTAAFATGLGLLSLALAYRGALGMGDVKLGFLLGAGLGKGILLALPLGFVGVFFPAVFLLATRGLAARKETIPFGPFLAGGAIVALLIG